MPATLAPLSSLGRIGHTCDGESQDPPGERDDTAAATLLLSLAGEKIPREDDGLRDTPLLLLLFVCLFVVVVVVATAGVMLGVVVSIEKPNYTKSPRELSTW